MLPSLFSSSSLSVRLLPLIASRQNREDLDSDKALNNKADERDLFYILLSISVSPSAERASEEFGE